MVQRPEIISGRSIAFGTLTSAVSKVMLKPTNRQTHWNFGDPHGDPVSPEEFLAQQEAAGFSFFEGKEPWLKGLHELSWQTFFRVCCLLTPSQPSRDIAAL
jgi:hypothetical protein